MRNFNCSINRTIQADTEGDALELFKAMLDENLLHKSIDIFEYPENGNCAESDHDQPN